MGWTKLATGVLPTLLMAVGCAMNNTPDPATDPYVPLPARGVSSAEPAPMESPSSASGASSPSSGGSVTSTGGGGTSSGVACGNQTCTGSKPQCCAGNNSFCVGPNDSCGGFRESCDQASDCPAGQVCCAEVIAGEAACMDPGKCTGVDKMFMCLVDSDCPAGSGTCRAVLANINHLVCK